MPNSIAPGFIQLEYTSNFGPHTAELPVNNVNIASPDGLLSTIDTWDAGTIVWTDMVDEMVDLLGDRMPSDVTYNTATLWSQPTPDDLPTFVAAYELGVAGTVAVPGYTKAVQETITARDTDGYVAKLVLLDMASTNNFDKQVTITAAGITDLWAAWSNTSNGWASRNGKRPATFIKATRTLNESLRRRYRQT